MLKLTGQEKQDIIRYLEADKPLPEKYRFLLFGDKREVELVWNGKTNEVCNIVLPFQTIEQVDEPRAEKPSDASLQMGLFSTDERGRQLKGWTNKLIWGDNKLILSSLKNGPLREEIEAQGGLKLIYIDPPFDVGADFSMDIEIPSSLPPDKGGQRGVETFTKKPNKNLPVWEEQWTGDYIFENEWQSFRTKKDRSLELQSVAHKCQPGRRKIAVKVVDIFGNDTMTIVEVTV